MHLVLLLFTGLSAADTPKDCEGGSCPMPHAPVSLEWTMPSDADPPPIDRRPASHLRTATFALG